MVKISFRKFISLATLVMLFNTSIMLPDSVSAATGALTVDFSITTLTGTPNVFGGTKAPQQAQQANIYPQLLDAGITRERGDFYFDAIIPSSKCASVNDYKNNVNNIQDANNWNYGHLFWIDDAKSHGLKTLVIADYTPSWLSYSGSGPGVPKDWGVWEDIVKKVYSRYKTKIDWVEMWNEPDLSSFDITGSPYTSKYDALADLMYHTVTAIRSVDTSVKTGGFAFYGWDNSQTTWLQEILSRAITKYGRSWVDTNFSFQSWHQYGADSGATDTSATKAVFSNLGLSTNKEIFIDEWNYTPDWSSTADELSRDKAIGFAGNSLSKFINAGVGADYFSLYPNNYTLVNTVNDDGIKPTLAFYSANGTTGTLLPQSYPFRILSNKLGLGKGNYAVKQISNQSVIDSTAAINAAGQKVVFIANYSTNTNSVNITLKGLSGTSATITEYWGAITNDGSTPFTPNNVNISNGTATYSVSMTPNTVVGLIVNDNGSGNTTNLALNKTATASVNNSGEEPGKAVDASTSTKWSANGESNWLQVDLGSIQNINRYVVKHAGVYENWGTQSLNTRDFKFQVSSNGSTWTDVDTVTGNTANVTDKSVSASGRYMRLNITNPQTESTYRAARIFEFEVYGGGIGNLMTNPGFEVDGATQTPNGWLEWNNTDASYTETNGGAHGGAYHGTHWSSSPYTVSTYQNKTGLANGTYTMTAWVKSSGGQTTAQMYIKNYGGTEMDSSIKNSISNWTQITITNINVTNGTAELGFYSVANANNYICFDDVSFVKQ